jgi:hypothetical protein
MNLWVKGPSNWIKDGIQPLEGVVETDWLTASFTMNWKLTRPNHPVRFEQGEPICMIVPVPRGLAEELQPQYLPLDSDPELSRQFDAWSQGREAFNKALDEGREDIVRRGWQKDYNKGLMPSGVLAKNHQTRLKLKEFVRPDEAEGAEAVRPEQPAPAKPETEGLSEHKE